MDNVKITKKHKNSQFEQTLLWLGYAYEIIAFINTYGPLYDNNYFAFILNLNNIIEHYLLNGDFRTIANIYIVYAKCKVDEKSIEETFQQLRMTLYNLPVVSVCEVAPRYSRRKSKI